MIEALTPADKARIGFAAQLAICVSRALTDVNPCGALYTVDTGWDTPLKFCACKYPAWEVTAPQ
jgi:hypothetical protein